MSGIVLNPAMRQAVGNHRFFAQRLGVPLLDERIRSIFKKAINPGALTYAEMFILLKLLEEDFKFVKAQDGVCATPGAEPSEQLRVYLRKIFRIYPFLKLIKEKLTDTEKIEQFYQTIGSLVLEEKYVNNIIRKYLGPEHDVVLSIIRDILNQRESLDILDVGSGKGRYLLEFAKTDQINAVGIDYSLLMNLLTIRIAQLRNLKVDTRLGDATEMEFPDDSFDVAILMYNTLGDIPKYSKALVELKRVIRPNGLILISVYSTRALDAQLELYGKIGLTIDRVTRARVYTKEGLISGRYTDGDLKRILNKSGFDKFIIQPVGIGNLAIVRT